MFFIDFIAICCYFFTSVFCFASYSHLFFVNTFNVYLTLSFYHLLYYALFVHRPMPIVHRKSHMQFIIIDYYYYSNYEHSLMITQFAIVMLIMTKSPPSRRLCFNFSIWLFVFEHHVKEQNTKAATDREGKGGGGGIVKQLWSHVTAHGNINKYSK